MAITVPVALQYLLTYGVALMDSIMVGALGETELSAVTVANQPFFLFTMCIFGLSSGAGVLIAQYWGKNDTETIAKVFGMTIRISMIVGVCVMLVVVLFPEQVMMVYTDKHELVPLGASYLRVVGASYLLFAFSSAYLNCIRNVERVKIALITYSISFCVNVFFNYVFIFGAFGAPRLGTTGAAVGTLLARISDFVIVFIYARREKRVVLKLKYFLKSDKILLKDYLRFSLPVVVNEMMWAFGFSAQTAILGRMSISAVASVSVVQNITQMMTVFIYGASSATLVITGKYIGAKEYSLARKNAPRLVGMNILIAAITAGVMLLLKDPMVSLYNVTDATKSSVDMIMILSAVIVVFQAINMACIVGVFRGGGDTLFAMYLDIIAMWAIAVPLGALGGLYFGLSVPAVFFLLRFDEVIKAFVALFRLRSGKWLKDVTRDGENQLTEKQ